ncbi:MAG: helix-hairpin-helix domain-containing protein [Myxococcota bacterium]
MGQAVARSQDAKMAGRKTVARSWRIRLGAKRAEGQVTMTVTPPNPSTSALTRRCLSRAVLQTSALLMLIIGFVLSASTARAAATPPGVRLAAAAQLDGKININTATADQLRLLPGVGPATAAKILAYRIRRPFGHATHLLRIKGIGRKTFGAIRRFITVEGETTLHVPADP